MNILEIRINDWVQPIGIEMNVIKCSWKVSESISQKMKDASISLYDEQGNLLDSKNGILDSTGTLLYAELLPRSVYSVHLQVTGDCGDKAEETTQFITGKQGEAWKAEWIGMQKDDSRHPVMFCEFPCKKEIKEAYLHISGLGLYEAYLNGQKIGDEYLSPLLSDYQEEIQVQTYVVTDFLKTSNRIEVLLGEGWYMGRFVCDKEKIWGDQMALIAELHIKYADGSSELIKTDEHWKYRGSDITMCNIYDGEDIDRTLWENTENNVSPVQVIGLDKRKLKDRFSLPVRIKEMLSVKKVIHTLADEIILDFGQNHAGWVQFNNTQPKGSKIRLDYGEILQEGNFYNENYRTARAAYTYVSNGEKELVRPHFTFYGYRYVRVTGWEGELNPEDFTACVLYSDIDRTGWFETDNEKINRLYENTVWGLKSNFLDMPTDCPQRDERLGWTGDAQVFAPTACFHMNVKRFYDKFLRDLRHSQKRLGGIVPVSIPEFQSGMNVSAVWGDAATIIPMTLYRTYGDRDMLSRHYNMMKDWVGFVTKEDDKRNPPHHLWDFGMQLGDWLALDGKDEQSLKGGTEENFIASVYYYNSLNLTAEAAEILEKHEESKKYLEKAVQVRKAILYEYFSPSGRLCLDTQTAYIIALHFGIYRDKGKIIEFLGKRLQKDDYKIRSGFVGAPFFCQTLCENGLEEMAYEILFNEEFPGWLYAVNLGATTVWERWNSVLPDGTVSGTGMNSLNHYSYGSVAQFLYEDAGGIQNGGDAWHKAHFAPCITGKFRYVKAVYDSCRGRYACSWEWIGQDKVRVKIQIPFDCTATVSLPEMEKKAEEYPAGNYEFICEPRRRSREQLLAAPFDSLLDNIVIRKHIGERTPGIIMATEYLGDEYQAMPFENILTMLEQSNVVDEKNKKALLSDLEKLYC